MKASGVMGDRAITIINNLTHTKGAFANQTFNLRPWQTQIIRKLFRTRKDGLRQYRTCLLMLPRKNGKSELAAALAIYFLLFDGEIGAEVYSAAADKDQAALVFNVAAQMIRNDPELEAQCEIIDSQKRIVHRKSGSFYRAISAEAYSKHGFNASVVIYDELHAAPNRELWDVLATSQGARLQPMMIAITTAGYDRHSILFELYDHAKKVLKDPSIDPTFLPILFEAPKDADWLDEKVWKKANPALGDFRSMDEMRIAAQRAQSIPAQENAFRRLYLNQWTEQAERWLQMESWDACRSVIDADALIGVDCVAGLDLATTTDIAACVLIFPQPDGRMIVQPHFWAPAEGIRKRSLTDRVPYDQWVKDGYLTATPGDVIDYDIVENDLNALARRYTIREIGYDPWNAEATRQRLERHGLTMTKVPQTMSFLNEATKRLGDLVVNKRLVHDGHPVLRWMASNMVVWMDTSGNIRPDKAKSTEKIDGIVATVIALSVWLRQPDSRPEDPELMVVSFAH